MQIFQSFIWYALAHGCLEWAYGMIMVPKYKRMVRDITGDLSTGSTWIWAVLGYAVYLLSTFYIVIMPIIEKRFKTRRESLTLAFVYSLGVYGVFNATNLYLFPKYNKRIALIDLVYGIASVMLLSLVFFEITTNHTR